MTLKGWIRGIGTLLLLAAIIVATVYFVRAFASRDAHELGPEHRIVFADEFIAEQETQTDWAAYVAIEAKLQATLETEVVALHGANDLQPNAAQKSMVRYLSGSLSDPAQQPVNWNHSQDLASASATIGSAVLLHGLSDSPYSLRGMAEHMTSLGYHTLVPRMPGHGFAVGGLRAPAWPDWMAAVRISIAHALKQKSADQPLILAGYSNGALLALRYALDCQQDESLTCPDGLVLLSPALEITAFAQVADWHQLVSWSDYFEKFQWETIAPGIDPFKFTAFPKSAGGEIYQLATEVQSMLGSEAAREALPPILAFQSYVDDTISPEGVVSHLFEYLPENGSELVFYDVNRNHVITDLIKRTQSLQDYITQLAPQNYAITALVNVSSTSLNVQSLEIAAGDQDYGVVPVQAQWPGRIFSLSHIALPFDPTDSVYGAQTSELGLGTLVPRGEREILSLAPNYFLRLRYNPFIEFQNGKVRAWLRVNFTIEP